MCCFAGCSKEFKDLEIIVLRHELAIIRRTTRRPAITAFDRVLLAVASRLLPRARWQSFIVTPATASRLDRQAWTDARPVGRPPMRREIRDLVLQLARESPRWGYPPMVGELKGLGIAVSATTVRAWLRAGGLGPAGKRRETTWCEFVQAHRQSLLAVDFFTVETIWLQRLYVLFFIELGSRRVHVAGCTPNPSAPWRPAGSAAVMDPGGTRGTDAVSDSRSGSETHLSASGDGRILRRDRLGGVVHEYVLAV